MNDEDWLVDFVEELKKRLRMDSSESNIAYVASIIQNAGLNELQKEFVWQYFNSQGYDRKTGMFMLCESDNSAFLQVVAIVKAKVEKK